VARAASNPEMEQMRDLRRLEEMEIAQRHGVGAGDLSDSEVEEEVGHAEEVAVEYADSGRSLGMHKVLLTPEKEVENTSQRSRLFRTTCKAKDRKCKVIVDSESIDNLVSTKMVEKLELETTDHPSPYKVSWLQKGHQVSVTKQCLVEFKIGGYNDKILCDVIPMDVCHVLLGRPWQYDRNVVHDGRMNTYTLEKDGRTHRLLPIKDKEVKPEVSKHDTSYEWEGAAYRDGEEGRSTILCGQEAENCLD
jgi:hypothetical protein